jgi:predicted 3-demethylubiquinone-9 3-methyltransferase (glyoxalase superfamily)
MIGYIGYPVVMSAFESFPRITPFLWFDSNAEEAVEFYISIFHNSRRLDELRQDEPRKDRSIITIPFELDGQKFTALNGGPAFTFNEAISLTVRCETQEEIDYYWEKLSAGGKELQCGWLKDKFGLYWQIVPSLLPDWVKTAKGMKAMMTMVKFDIAALELAASA